MSEHMGGPPTGALAEGPGKSADEYGTDVRVHGDRDRYGDSAQLTIDDALEDARRARDRGLDVATYATDVAWAEAADRAIRDLAAAGEPFDADTLRALVGPPTGSPNVLGSRFMAAARRGLIVKAGRRQSTRPEAHGRDLQQWRGVT